MNLVSPYPVHAEPGELGSAISIPMDTLARTPKNYPMTTPETYRTRTPKKYRLFLVTISPCETFRGNIPEQAKLRTTLLFASEQHWPWCEEQNLIELDIFNNSILSLEGAETALHEPCWQVATQFASREHGTRSVRVVVAITDDVGSHEEPFEVIRTHSVAHLFRVRVRLLILIW